MVIFCPAVLRAANSGTVSRFVCCSIDENPQKPVLLAADCLYPFLQSWQRLLAFSSPQAILTRLAETGAIAGFGVLLNSTNLVADNQFQQQPA